MMADLRADGFLVADEDGVLVDINEVGCRMLARPKSDLVGRSLASRDQLRGLGEVWRRWPELRTAGEIAGAAAIQHVDGETAPVEYFAKTDIPISGWTMVRLRQSGN